MYTSSEIVEVFASYRLKPVWNQEGDGVKTACATTALRVAGYGMTLQSDADIQSGWDCCYLAGSSICYKDTDQWSEALLASVQMRCTSHRVARGSWQQDILASIIAFGCIRNPMSALRGRALSYAGRYRRSFDNLLRRLAAAGPWPIYRIVDRTGRVWYSTREIPDGPAYPLRSVSEIRPEDAR